MSPRFVSMRLSALRSNPPAGRQPAPHANHVSFVTGGPARSYPFMNMQHWLRNNTHRDQLVMKTFLAFSISGVLGLMVLAPSAHSAPLRRADVIADPVWVLHVDVDGLRPT